MKTVFKIITAALMMSCLILISGCDFVTKNQSTSSAYTVVDATGKEVIIPHKPVRILGADASIDTMLLGLITPDRLMAATEADRDPAISYIADDVKDKELVIPLSGLSMETITRAKPDLIVASTYTKAAELDLYRNLGIPVVVIDGPRSIEQVKESVTLLAAACDEKEAGRKVLSEMNRQLAEIDQVIGRQTGKKPVVFLISQMTRYGGPGSMFHELVTRAGLENALALAGNVNGQAISPEMIVKVDPDLFFVSTDRKSDTTGASRYRDAFLANPAIAAMRASRHICPLEDRYIYSASQNCVYAIKAMANAGYGPLFPMSDEKQIRGY